MKKLFAAIALTLSCGAAAAQLTVEECWDLARANYPLIERMGLIEQAQHYTVQNASRGYLPQLQLTARATYQSDVTTISLEVPGIEIPTLPKDNYDAKIELQQVIWDGGRIGAAKQNAVTAADVSRQSLEVDLYSLRERVNQLFFGVLLLDGQLEQLKLTQDDLARNYDRVSALIKGGVANRADLDAVRAQQIEMEQNRISMSSSRESYMAMLGMMIGREGEQKLTPPAGGDVSSSQINRPELWLMDAQDANFQAQLKNISSKNLPTLGAFVQGGYGKPGLNMFKTTFEPYYVAGLRLSWNFGSLYTKKNEKRLVDNSRQGVAAQRETFLFNTRMQLVAEQRKIGNIKALMLQDDELVTLRGNIRRSAEAKVENGTMSGVELMREVTAENLARQARVLHKVQLWQAIYEMKTTTNN